MSLMCDGPISDPPACCEHCHGRDGLQKVIIQGKPYALCCSLVAEIMARTPHAVVFDDPVYPKTWPSVTKPRR
jgi:hypothetical protein